MATQLGQLSKGCEDETQRPVKAHGHRICRKSAADIEAKEACTVYLQKMDFRKFALHDLDKELDSPQSNGDLDYITPSGVHALVKTEAEQIDANPYRRP